MRHRHLLMIAVPLAVGACAEVLGLDEPTVRGEGGGGSTTGTTAPGATSTGTASPTAAGGSGPGSGGGTGATGGGGSEGCVAHADCDDTNPCTIDVCSDGACVNEASGVQPADDPDDCVDVTCAGDVPTFTPDDTEVAANPNPPCHTAVCQEGVAVDVFAPAKTPCGDSPLECDGRGSCTGCTTDADCTGGEGPCAIPTCEVDGVCDPGLLDQGTVVDDPEGDCRAAICTGASSMPNFAYDPDDLPTITCAVVTCKPDGPDVRPANDGTPCTVGFLTGVCTGNDTGDAACVECESQEDCELHPGGDRCSDQSGTCGCSFGGDCQGYWRAGAACISGGQVNGTCGCNLAGDCSNNMHGDACVGDACGCADDADCEDAALGETCVLAEARCGCSLDAECATSQLGTDCLAAGMRCGCDADADCPVGSNCLLELGFCL